MVRNFFIGRTRNTDVQSTMIRKNLNMIELEKQTHGKNLKKVSQKKGVDFIPSDLSHVGTFKKFVIVFTKTL